MKLIRDYAALASGQAASKLIAFLAFAWLARVLDPAGYGTVEYLVGLATFFSVLVDGGLSVTAVTRIAQDRSALRTLAFQIPIARLLLAALAVPVMLLVARFASASEVPAGLAWLFALSLFAIPWRQEWLLQVDGRMTRLAVAQVVRVGVFAILAWMLVGAPQDLPAVGWAEVAATTAMTAYCIYVQHTAIVPLRLAGSLRGMAALANESAPVAMSNVIWTITQYAPLFLIASRVGGEQTGWFAGATRVVVSLLIFSSLYHFNLYPAVSRALSPRDGNPGALLARSFRVAAWSGIFAALALTLLAEPLMVLAMGANMRPATPMLQIMAWVLPVVLCSGHARAALVAVGARARMLVAQLAGLVATVLFGLLLGRVAGGVGYAAAAVAGAIVVWIFAQVLAARRGCSPPPFKLAVRPALLAAAVLVGAQALSAGIWQSLAGLLLFAAAAPLVDRRLIQDFLKLGAAGADAAD